MKPKPLITGLALASLFFAVLLPPEAYPDGKLAVILAATFVFFTSLIERRISPAYTWGGLGVFGLLLVHSLTVSVDLYRSLEFLSVLWAYYCLIGFFAYAGFEPTRPVAVTMVALSILVSGYGIYQYFWGFEQLYSFVTSSTSGEIAKVKALERISDRRVFSTFALPGTLWGFLVISIPFHAALWGKGRLTNAVLVVSALLVFATGFLTRSFGFVLGLLVLAAAWVLLRHRRLVWNRMAAIVVVLAIIAAAFYSGRREVIEGSNPASLRVKNWVSAWTIFAANPLGTGLNTYGVVYSRHMLPGANETQYTHNTSLQLLSELGYPLLLAGAAALLLIVHRWRDITRRSLSPWLVAAFAVWLAHNMVDINVYFPSVGVIGAVIIGTLLRKEPQSYPANRTALISFGGVGLCVLTFSALAMVSTELQNRAKGEFEENRLSAAGETLAQARRIMPLNSSLHHEAGDVFLNLYHKRHDLKYLDDAKASFRRAIQLSPEKSGPHSGLGLSLASSNEVDAAMDEIHLAQQRYPDNTELQAIRRLLQKRRLSAMK